MYLLQRQIWQIGKAKTLVSACWLCGHACVYITAVVEYTPALLCCPPRTLFLAGSSSAAADGAYIVLAGSKTAGYLEVFAKQGQPPGWHYSQYDFRPTYQYFQDDDEEKDQEIKFDVQSAGFQTGTPCLEPLAALLNQAILCLVRQIILHHRYLSTLRLTAAAQGHVPQLPGCLAICVSSTETICIMTL